MRTSSNNPWVDAVIEQMWIYCQAIDVVAKSIDVDLLSDPQALSQYCLYPSERRLNPLEFHGKRRSAAPAASASASASASTAPRARGRHQEADIS